MSIGEERETSVAEYIHVHDVHVSEIIFNNINDNYM